MKKISKLVLAFALVALLAVMCVATVAFANTDATPPVKATAAEVQQLKDDVAAGRDVELNGKLYEVDQLVVESGKTVTLKNGYIVDTDTQGTNVTIVNNGTLTLENVTVRGIGIVVYNLGVLEVKDGTVIGPEQTGTTQTYSAAAVYTGVNAAGIAAPETKLTGGVYYGSIVVENGYLASLAISGGTFHGNIENMNTTVNFTVSAGNFDGIFYNLSDFVAGFSENENVKFSEAALDLNPLSAGSYRWKGLDDEKYSCVVKVSGSGSSSSETQPSWFSKYGSLIILGVVVVVMILFMIIPQRKQKKKAEEMMNSLQVGSTITTIGGIVGNVVALTDNTVTIETGIGEEKRTMELVRQAIHSVQPANAPVQEVAAPEQAATDETEDEIK